jgi:biopolymer transport protein ExbB/TolQ
MTHPLYKSILFSIVFSASAYGSVAHASTPVDQKTEKELADTQKKYADMRLSLYREINAMDDQAVALSKELKELTLDEEKIAAKNRKIEKEKEGLKAELAYVSGVLAQYAKAIVSRLHPAEFQLYRTEIESLDQKAASATNDLSVELQERLKIIAAGIGRIEKASGGYPYEGKAIGISGKTFDGTLYAAGPAIFFAAKDGTFEGIASLADTGTLLPSVVSLASTQGGISRAIQSGDGEVPLDGTGGRAIENLLKQGGESHSGAMEHVMLFGDIAKNMMFDGWIAIGVCVLMIFVGWTVALRKIYILNSVKKGNEEFLRKWQLISNDLTALDHTDLNSVKSFGGIADQKSQSLLEKSVFFEIYHIGSEEIRHRLEQDRTHRKGLTGRSIQAIRAALDSGLVRVQHKLTDGLVYLTISIAGGPYVGLLGTVVGVMITFAIIAKSGEVDVNSIAPGIASALLATVAGLIVAIPALFVYSYLNTRIRNMVSEIQVFIDEFVTKVAEFYQGSENHPTNTTE